MYGKKKRMNVYIDLNNLENEAEKYNQVGLVLNYTELIRIVSKQYSVEKVYFFDSEPSHIDDVSEKQLMRIHNILKNAGYTPMLYKPQHCPNNTQDSVQKEVDTGFCCQVDKENYKNVFDTALFLTGDRDMCPAAKNIQEEGKEVIVVAFEPNFAECLKEIANEYHFIEDLDCMEIVSEFGYMNRINTADPLTDICGGE